MSTASLMKHEPHDERPNTAKAAPARKPPMPLRSLHRMWRRTIDNVLVTEVSLPVRQLPAALTGVVACQISDFHLDRDEDVARLHGAVEAINQQRPDLVFLTGDYFSGPDTMRRYLGEFRDAVRRLRPRTALFAILGNHDHWASADQITTALKQSNADVLINDSRRLSLGGEKLVVVGIDDLWSRRAEPARAFAHVAPEDPTIVLAHNPDTALYARHLKPGVMLSGHTHGGVVRIPFYGSPLKSILKIGKEFYSGLNRYEDFYIYTNRGLGTFWVRIRINCPPEVSRFTLTPYAESAGTASSPTEVKIPEKRPRRQRVVRSISSKVRKRRH
jgi:uncharacterized protein